MISRVQTKTGTGSAPTVNITWNGDTTTGNLIVIAIGTQATSVVSSITDSQSNSYSKVDGTTNTNDGELWYAENITGGTTPTVTITLTSILSTAAVMREYSGIAASALDAHTITTMSNNAKAFSTAASVSAQPNELVVGYISTSTTTPTVDSSFSNLSTVSNSVIVGLADRISNAKDSHNVQFTVGSAESTVVGVAGFKDNEIGNGLSINKLRPRTFAPGLAR